MEGIKCLSQKKWQSPSLQVDGVDFRYITPFRNQSSSKATGVENQGQGNTGSILCKRVAP